MHTHQLHNQYKRTEWTMHTSYICICNTHKLHTHVRRMHLHHIYANEQRFSKWEEAIDQMMMMNLLCVSLYITYIIVCQIKVEVYIILLKRSYVSFECRLIDVYQFIYEDWCNICIMMCDNKTIYQCCIDTLRYFFTDIYPCMQTCPSF